MGRAIIAVLILSAALAPGLAQAAPWPPSNCYEGYAYPRGSAVEHRALLCDAGGGRGELELYRSGIRVEKMRFDLEIVEMVASGGAADVTVERWIVDGADRLHLAHADTAKGGPLLASPAAGGGSVDFWHVFVTRYYP